MSTNVRFAERGKKRKGRRELLHRLLALSLAAAFGLAGTFVSAESAISREFAGQGILAGFQDLERSGARNAVVSLGRMEISPPSGAGGSVLRPVVLGIDSAMVLKTRDGVGDCQQDWLPAHALVAVQSNRNGQGQSSREMVLHAAGVARMAGIFMPTMSGHSRSSQNFAGKSPTEWLFVNRAISGPTNSRKPGEFGEQPTGLAAADAEPSRGMKQVLGRCDGQGVPRKGMRPTSARPEREDMTCAFGEPKEAGNRKPAITTQILSPVDTPLFTMFRKTRVSNVQTEWLTDLLDQATSNATAEGSQATFQAVTSRTRLLNYTQISREAYDVSDTQRAVNPAGIRDELRYVWCRAAA